MFIYQIKNMINGHSYIGKTTKTIQSRFLKHCESSKRSNVVFAKAIQKYGKDKFQISLLEECSSLELLNEREKYWIKQLNPEYNMTPGGDGGDTSSSPLYIQYMKNVRPVQISGNNNPFFGRTHSEETKKKISLANKGRKCSEEQKELYRKLFKGRIPKNLDQLIENNKKRAKTYYLIDKNGNELVVHNMSEFCKIHGYDQRNMSSMYIGKYKTSRGYKRNLEKDPR